MIICCSMYLIEPLPSSERQFNWNWVDTVQGDYGFIDDYGNFIQDWKVMP